MLKNFLLNNDGGSKSDNCLAGDAKAQGMVNEEISSQQVDNTTDSEMIDILRLARSQNIGPKTFFALIDMFGSAKGAIENISDFAYKGGRKAPIKVYSQNDAINEIERIGKTNAKIVSYKCKTYSQLLSKIYDPPPILTYKGNIALLNKSKTLGVVGARNASVNAQFFAAKISQELAREGYILVSGFARGIDSAVHKSTPQSTIAVFAGGIDYIYPPENLQLYQHIAEAGLIVAELGLGAKPTSHHFPQRNRIISGLSLGVIVVEASLKSGSLITAKFAIEQNREVFAVPGFPLDPRSLGSNKLIKQGAHIVESAEDITSNITSLLDTPQQTKCETYSSDYTNTIDKNKIISFPEPNKKPCASSTVSHKNFDFITNQMRHKVLNILSCTPVPLDYIATKSEIEFALIYPIMMELELAGKVTRYNGNKFCLNAQNQE